MKVLIAEDEFYARERLKKILTEEEIEVAVVENGAVAVEYLELNSDIDIVITDVIMPKLTGLQLAEYIHANMPYIQVIIVSGYEEFEYARKAIEYGVKTYLVKPAKKEELRENIHRMYKEKQDLKNEFEEEVQRRLANISEKFLKTSQIVKSQEAIRKYFPSVVNNKYLNQSRLVLLQIDKSFEESDIEMIQSASKKYLYAEMQGAFFCRTEEEFLFLLKLENDNSEIIKLQELISYLRIKLKASLVIGVSKSFIETVETYDAYKECQYAINNRLIDGWNNVFEFNSLNGEIKVFDLSEENRLMNALKLSDYEKASQFVHEEIQECKDINTLYDMILNILHIINKFYRMQNHTLDSKADIMFSRRYDLYSFRHLKELKEYIDCILKEICNQSSREMLKGKNAIIKDICHYVEKNYYHNLSLQELAEKKYFMNASYLSRLFKSEVGRPFSRYVIDCRIKKALELLEDETLKVSDIAYSVGYNHTSHFIQSFKRICDCTPDEMRNSIFQSKLNGGGDKNAS